MYTFYLELLGEIIMNPVVVTMILLLVLALGELISILTKARVPMLLASLMIYLVLLWTGIVPAGLMSDSLLKTFGSLAIAPLIVHLGTLIPFSQIKGQVKPIVIAVTSSLFAVGLVLLIVTAIFDYTTAVSGAGPVVGGIVAFLLTSEKLTQIGLGALAVLPALILAIHKLAGIPFASYFLKKHALSIKASIKDGSYKGAASESANPHAEETRKSLLPAKFQTPIVLLAQLFIAGSIAIGLDALTGINYSIFCLIIGIVGTYFGVLQPQMLNKANSTGIFMASLMLVVIASMDQVTPDVFFSYLPQVFTICLIGTVGVIIGGFIMSKLLKYEKNLGIPVALTALFGFPADYILCEEVAREVGENEEERAAIMNGMVTPMLMGGFATVTTGSIVIASILVETL